MNFTIYVIIYHSFVVDGEIDEKSGISNEMDNEIFEIVDSVVPSYDNPATPVMTFRVWLLGIFLVIVLSVINTLFTFRTNPFVRKSIFLN